MTCGRNSSAQIQRTTCQPRSRSASSRSFSRMTASSMVSSLRRSRRYFALPSNSPSVRSSGQPKSAAPDELAEIVEHVVLRLG